MHASYVQGSYLSADYTPPVAVPAGSAVVRSGRVGVAHTDLEALVLASLAISVGAGVFEFAKATGVVILDGGRVYFDPSTEECSFKRATAHALYVGTAVGDYASTDTTIRVCVNALQAVLIDIANSAVGSTIVKTAGTPALTRVGGSQLMTFSTTAEAQKVDLLSVDGFDPARACIIEGIVEIASNGDAAAIDFNIGVANGTHASDADSITQAVLIHVDGNSLNILAASRDGATTVAAADTGADFALNTPFEFWLDMRDPEDVKVYVDGVRVLAETDFKTDAATGPLKLLAHVEKTADDTPGDYRIHRLIARRADL